MFIDTHAHLFFKEFEHDLDAVVDRARNAGVQYIVCPGTDLETSRASIALAERYDCVYAAVGFHPHDAKKAVLDDGSQHSRILAEIEELSCHPKVVAIGEIGLDYHYNYSPPEIQRSVFSAHIAMARRRDLPIIIHTRESEHDVLRIVEEHVALDKDWLASKPKGVFHCFSGDVEMARKVIGWRFFISIPGPITFPPKKGKTNTMEEVVHSVPLRHILLETDSPYLTPHPHRGKRNEPSYIPIIANRIAEVQNTPVEEVGTISSVGARELFHLPSD